MIIYGALFIPLLVAFILYKYFSHKTVWWEFFIPLVASLIFTFSMKLTIEAVQVSSKEYWGSIVDRVEYYEDWNEWITQTCTRSCCCDSKGENCGTETYDCSYCLYHPPIWRIVTTTGETIDIDQSEYVSIKRKLGNEQFFELNRSYYTDDGDEYYSKWQNDSSTAIPVTTLHHYENRVKAADQSVFHFEDVSKADVKKYSLKEYPEILTYYKMQSVIGDSSEDALLADKKFCYINGLLGHKKEVRIFVLIFKNQPIDAGLYQEWYWSGANMNEFVICIGIDKERNVKWCKPISWTRSEILKAEVKNFVQSQTKLNLSDVADFTKKQVDKEFVRRSFKEFNYLTVEPPMWAVILTYLLTIAINIGLSYWIIRNEAEEK
jgi:hypothetical protein